MATPVSTEAPPRGHLRTGSEQERDLQAKVQHMISLQCQEQKLSKFEWNGGEDPPAFSDDRNFNFDIDSNSNKGIGGGSERGLSLGLSKQRHATKTHTNLLGLEGITNTNAKDGDPAAKALHTSTRDYHNDVDISREEFSGVGKGTIVFTGSLSGSRYATGSNGNPGESPGKNASHPQHYPQPDKPPAYSQEVSSHSTTLESQKQHLLSSLQQTYPGYGGIGDNNQNHEFHYGNPDYDNLDDHDYHYGVDQRDPFSRGDNRTCCARWCAPLVELLGQENLRRSFCYGAIDGLLTGAGIASALWGLGVLTVRTRTEIRAAIVALTVAACSADALCMAAGHVWTSYIVTSNHAWERSRERQLLEQDKADSKARLVDMLLARGMLKIDAMSLADTLEGYPDLFVSALVGDSLLSSGIQDALLDERIDPDGYASPYSDPATEFDGGGAFFGSFGSWKLPMHFDSDRDAHRSLEEGHVRAVYHESQKESLFMMMGFASFAMVPSLLWLLLPEWFDKKNAEPIPSYHSQWTHSDPHSYPYSGPDDGESVNIPSLIILILSGVVWCLGVWKSRFVDSNWVVFGLETIAVLLVCISSSYGIAALVARWFGVDGFISKLWTLSP